jgi:hypothetical protein
MSHLVDILRIIISWPVVVIIVFLVLKKDISNLLNKANIQELAFKDLFKIIFSGQYQTKKETGKHDELMENIYEKMTGAQLRFLVLLREASIKGRGLDCGYVSNYFQQIIKSKTDRYDGWITPFITQYLQDNNLLSVADNYYKIEKLGEDFLKYIEDKGYSTQDKPL